MAPPSSYATPQQWEASTAHLPDLDVPEDVQSLLDRATEDIDSYLRWPLPPDPLIGEPPSGGSPPTR